MGFVGPILSWERLPFEILFSCLCDGFLEVTYANIVVTSDHWSVQLTSPHLSGSVWYGRPESLMESSALWLSPPLQAEDCLRAQWAWVWRIVPARPMQSETQKPRLLSHLQQDKSTRRMYKTLRCSYSTYTWIEHKTDNISVSTILLLHVIEADIKWPPFYKHSQMHENASI